MGLVLRDGRDPWTARKYGKDGRVIIEGEFTDVMRSETMEDEIKRLVSDSEQLPESDD